MGDTGVTKMIPDQRIRHVSESDLGRRSESGRPWVCPASRVEHRKDPEIDRVNIHPMRYG